MVLRKPKVVGGLEDPRGWYFVSGNLERTGSVLVNDRVGLGTPKERGCGLDLNHVSLVLSFVLTSRSKPPAPALPPDPKIVLAKHPRPPRPVCGAPSGVRGVRGR